MVPAGLSTEEIGRRAGLSVEVVEAYESAFFAVRVCGASYVAHRVLRLHADDEALNTPRARAFLFGLSGLERLERSSADGPEPDGGHGTRVTTVFDAALAACTLPISNPRDAKLTRRLYDLLLRVEARRER